MLTDMAGRIISYRRLCYSSGPLLSLNTLSVNDFIPGSWLKWVSTSTLWDAISNLCVGSCHSMLCLDLHHGRGEGTKIEIVQTAVGIVIYTPDTVVVVVVGIRSHLNTGNVVSLPFLSPVVGGGDACVSK